MTQLAPMGGPPVARFGHSQGYDPLSNLMVVSMGRHDNPVVWPTLFNDVWVLTNANGFAEMNGSVGVVPELGGWLAV